MKKSILALIISPLFIHSANANMKPFTDVIPHGLGSGTLFEFAEKKTDGDRAVGVSEIEQVTTGLGQFILENYEYVDDVRKDSSKKAAEQDGKITQVHQIVTDTSGRVNTLEKQTAFLENKTQAMDIQLDITARKAEHNNTLIGTLPEQINRILPDAIKSELSPLEARTEVLENKTEEINTKTNSMTMLFNEIPVLIKQEFETHQSDVDTQIEQLRNISHFNDINIHEEKRNAASTKVVTQALLGATEDLETDVDKLKNKVRAVELQASFAKHLAYTSEKDIRENKNQLGVQSRDIAKNKKLLESAKVVTSAITDATLALEADVAKMDTRISNASKKAGTATNIANQNTRHIAEQKVKVEKNTLDILKNRQDLRALENDLRETNERLDNGLAASAALNGLFQPYGVGKLNITAAVGGYQSTQAVAMGTGYRFNENIAVKTGMAYTGSNDVMYNMAVNLEW